MNDRASGKSDSAPLQAAEGSSSDISSDARQARLVGDELRAITNRVTESRADAHKAFERLDKQIETICNTLREDMREIRADAAQARTDHHRLLYIFGAGFIVVAGLIVGVYCRLDDRIETKITKVDEKLQGSLLSLSKVETKLGDLLDRIPPNVTPAPKR